MQESEQIEDLGELSPAEAASLAQVKLKQRVANCSREIQEALAKYECELVIHAPEPGALTQQISIINAREKPKEEAAAA